MVQGVWAKLAKVLRDTFRYILARTAHGETLSAKPQNSTDSSSESLHPLSDEYRDFIQKSLDAWCANSGYKDCDDCTVNMLTLSRTLSIPKDELSAYFDQYLKTIFRIGLGDIRFNAAKKMIVLLPNGGRKWLLM